MDCRKEIFMVTCDKCKEEIPDGPSDSLRRNSKHLSGSGGDQDYTIALWENDGGDLEIDLCPLCLEVFIIALLKGPDGE